MVEEPLHPITTPKGASALTILLGAVSVFAPFLFDLRAAILFGLLAILVIGWVYSTEVKLAWTNQSWNTHLNVPLLSVAVIVLMGIVSARNVANTPGPVPAVSADQVAERVENWLQRHQSRPPSAGPQQVAVMQPRRPDEGLAKPGKTPHRPTNGPTTSALDPHFFEKLRDSTTRFNVWSKCNATATPVTVELYKLINEGAIDQNNWAYSRDGELLRQQYENWIGEVREFFSENQRSLPDTAEFDQVTELDMGPTLLVIPNSGVNAWHNFDERRKALKNIADKFDATACKAEHDALETK